MSHELPFMTKLVWKCEMIKWRITPCLPIREKFKNTLNMACFLLSGGLIIVSPCCIYGPNPHLGHMFTILHNNYIV